MYKGDLTELQAAYDLYAGKDLSIYTQDSKTVLEEALKEAEKVLKLGENAVKEDVNEALEKTAKSDRRSGKIGAESTDRSGIPDRSGFR